jgi:hypothetical protein
VNSSQRRWLATLIGTAACAVALCFAQLLVARAGWRADLSPEQRYVLSDHARNILGALDRPVEIVAFLRADDARNREIDDLLKRVRRASPQVSTRIVDVNRNPALAREYAVDAFGAVVVESGGKRRDFTNPNEQTLMAAIIQVTRPARRRVYFTAGYGERAISERDRDSGYSNANVALINELYEVGDVVIDAQTPVPDDAAALVVAAPRRDLPPGRCTRSKRTCIAAAAYWCCSSPTGVRRACPRAAPLRRRGQRRDRAGRGAAHVRRRLPDDAGAGPCGRASGECGASSTPLMSGVRAVRSAGTDSAQDGIDLLTTSPESWRTPDLRALERGSGDFLPGRDTRGPVPVGASVLVPNDGGHAGRLLVYGDADFASNALLGYLGNRDLLLNSVNWLAGEETMLGSRPPSQAPGVNQLFISARQGETIFWLGAVTLPAAILVFGLSGVALRQRRG